MFVAPRFHPTEGGTSAFDFCMKKINHRIVLQQYLKKLSLACTQMWMSAVQCSTAEPENIT